jgi:hypothetical protein
VEFFNTISSFLPFAAVAHQIGAELAGQGRLCGRSVLSLRLRQGLLFVFDSKRYVTLPRPVWCAFVFVTEIVIKVKVAV